MPEPWWDPPGDRVCLLAHGFSSKIPLSLSPPPRTAIGSKDDPRRQQTPKLQEDSSSIPVVMLAQPWHQRASRYNFQRQSLHPSADPGMPDDAGISPSSGCGGVLHLGSASWVPHHDGATQGCPFPSCIPLFQPLMLVCVGSQCFPGSCLCIYPSGYWGVQLARSPAHPRVCTGVCGRANLLQLFCPSVLRHWLFWTPMEPEEEMTSLSSFPPPAFLILLLLFLLLPLLFLLLVLLLYYYFSFFGGFWFS